MSLPTHSGREETPSGPTAQALSTQQKIEDCFACRVVGTGTLAGVGIYALIQSRAHAPGSPMGKRVMAGLGICFLGASVLRWTK